MALPLLGTQTEQLILLCALADLRAVARQGQSSRLPSSRFVPAHRTVLLWGRFTPPTATLLSSHLPHSPPRKQLLNTDAVPHYIPPTLTPTRENHTRTLRGTCEHACKDTHAQSHYHIFLCGNARTHTQFVHMLKEKNVYRQ